MYRASVPESSIGRVMLSIHRLWPSSWRSCVAVMSSLRASSARRRACGWRVSVAAHAIPRIGPRHLPRPAAANLPCCEPVTLVDVPGRARVASKTGKRPRGGLRREDCMRHGRIRGALLAGVILTVALAAPVGAITNGQPDEGEHPYVGQLFFYVPDEV